LNKKFNYYKHRISYLTGTCYNFEMEEFFSSLLRRAGMPASAGLSCFSRRRCRIYCPVFRRSHWIFSVRLLVHSISKKSKHGTCQCYGVTVLFMYLFYVLPAHITQQF